MSSSKPETVFDLEELFTDINRSFLTAANQLKKELQKPEWESSPYVYHMPRMQLSMRLALSYSSGKVKGFFSKKSSKEEQEIVSTIDVEVVAVPNNASRSSQDGNS